MSEETIDTKKEKTFYSNLKFWMTVMGFFIFYLLLQQQQIKSEISQIKKNQDETRLNQEQPATKKQENNEKAYLINLSNQQEETVDDDQIIQPSNKEKLSSLIPGAIFTNYCLSGEEGEFEDNGVINVSWGESYTPDMNTDENQRTASWSILGNQLILSDTQISDGVYSDFKYQDINGQLIIDTRKNQQGCGVIIAKNKSIIDQYLDQ